MMASFPDLTPTSPSDQKLINQNRRIRKYLTNRKGKISSSHKKRLLELRQKNHNKIFRKDPYTGADLKDVEKQAQAASTVKYSTAWKNLNDQIGGQENALSKLPSYYDRRFNDLTQVGANQAAAAAAIQQKLQQDSAAMEQQTQGFRDTLANEAQQNPATTESSRAAQDASSGRAQSAANTGANIRAVGDVGNSTYQGLAQNTRKEQGEKNEEYGQRIAKLKGDQAELAKEIGQDFISQKAAILSGIGDQKVKAAAVAASSATDAAALAEKTRHNKAGEGIAQQNADANTTRANKYGKSGSSKNDWYGGKKLSQEKRATMTGQIKAAKRKFDWYERALGKGSDKWSKEEWDLVRKGMAQAAGHGAGSGDLVINAAINWGKYGKVHANTIADLHAMGYVFKGSGIPT